MAAPMQKELRVLELYSGIGGMHYALIGIKLIDSYFVNYFIIYVLVMFRVSTNFVNSVTLHYSDTTSFGLFR